VAARSRVLSRMRKEKAAVIVDRLPEPGEYLHVISNGSFDYWDLIGCIADKAGPSRFWGSTWTMNRTNAKDLLDRLDKRGLLEATLLTGLYFKRRETAVYALISQGLLTRGQRYRSLETHAKVALLESKTGCYVLEGSANFTGNPRVEQTLIANSRPLLDFHREWIEAAARADE
jgi:lipid-A-disaccharide synthase-like uncharacterized protein